MRPLERNGPIPQRRVVGVRPITREDLGRLMEPRTQIGMPQKLRNSHHNVARLAALGMKNIQIAERVGMTRERVGVLLKSPAMQELVASYRERIDEVFVDSVDAYFDLATRNMVAAERHIADRIDDLDEKGELLPLREALAVSRDAADRFGYGKKATNVNLNVDFAAKLEAAISRSGKTVPTSQAVQDGGGGEVVTLPPPKDRAPTGLLEHGSGADARVEEVVQKMVRRL